MLRQLRHKNIVNFGGAFVTEEGDGIILMVSKLAGGPCSSFFSFFLDMLLALPL
jgi:hypothetical protein